VLRPGKQSRTPSFHRLGMRSESASTPGLPHRARRHAYYHETTNEWGPGVKSCSSALNRGTRTAFRRHAILDRVFILGCLVTDAEFWGRSTQLTDSGCAHGP
jgi:hypothetical protein